MWIIAWPPYIRSEPASGAMASSGTARMISSTSSRSGSGLGEDAVHLDERAEPLAAARVAAGDRLDRPAGAAQRDAERRADRARPDDADDRRLARPRVDVRVDVVARVRLVAVAVAAGRDRIEVDAGRLDRRPCLRAVLLGIVAGQVAPAPHQRVRGRPAGFVARPRIECSEPGRGAGPVGILMSISTRGGRTRPAPTDPAHRRGR